jgi:hypothetical protein
VFGGLYTTRGQGSHPDPWSLLEALYRVTYSSPPETAMVERA